MADEESHSHKIKPQYSSSRNFEPNLSCFDWVTPFQAPSLLNADDGGELILPQHADTNAPPPVVGEDNNTQAHANLIRRPVDTVRYTVRTADNDELLPFSRDELSARFGEGEAFLVIDAGKGTMDTATITRHPRTADGKLLDFSAYEYSLHFRDGETFPTVDLGARIVGVINPDH